MIYQIGPETPVFSTDVVSPIPEPQVVGIPNSLGEFAILWSTLGDEYSTIGAAFSSTGTLLTALEFTGTPNPTAIAAFADGLLVSAQVEV
jgi:hypothetical protein